MKPLTQPISLWVISGSMMESHPQAPSERIPKLEGELRSPVTGDVRATQVSMNARGDPVNHRQEVVEALRGRQGLYHVHMNVVKPLLWHRKKRQ